MLYGLQDLTKKQEYWMEKFEKDKDAKQHELDVLKASKAKDLERLQELTKLVSFFLSLCVCVHLCVCMCASMHVCVCVYTSVLMCMYTCACVHLCLCACVCVGVCVCACVICVHACVYV